jgi:hypothetical protein
VGRLAHPLRRGAGLIRQIGPRAAAEVIAHRVAVRTLGRPRRALLRIRPIRIGAEQVNEALGAGGAAGGLARAASALPTVTQWITQLDSLERPAAAELCARADAIVAHRFDLLGSGPTELGPTIDWQRDFKTGRSWPLAHISLIQVSYQDASDIKVPWELSRCQHLPLLAAAHRVSGDDRYLDEIGSQLQDWIRANPVEFGANWACTMDVAIRSVNWLAALLIVSDAVRQPWLEEVIASLLLHCRFIRRHLESGPARGNHYLSDVVGLLCTASLFATSAEGQTWVAWAVDELGREMQHEVRADGCCHEASISYHRLVCELFIVAADAAEALVPGSLDPIVRVGIERMLGFVADYTKGDGLAPQIGDADNGRLLPLDDYARADQRSHLHLFGQARRQWRPASRSAAYPAGGFYVLRAGELHAVVRCGDVGIYGRGCHAHNDLLAFELSHGAQPLVSDAGSYVYTANPGARNWFRSIAVHNALSVDGAEQNEILPDRLFAMEDRAQAEVIAWEVGEGETTLVGRHFGFAGEPTRAVHTRTLTLSRTECALEVVDRVESAFGHEISFVLALEADRVDRRQVDLAVAFFADCELHIQCDGLEIEPVDISLSAGYGERHPVPGIRLRGRSDPGRDQVKTVLSVRSNRT